MKVVLLSGRLTRSTAHSAGFDLYATQDVCLPPQSFAVVGTGVRTKMTDCYALLRDRSGLAAKYGISIRGGVIDQDYEGEWMVVIHNESREAYQINVGDRIAQALFMPMVTVEVVGEGVELKQDVRSGGIGSTGQ